ncbi:putative 4-hydroxybenzoate transporter PcaK [Georgfuchsia toluolica]|uniref:4-hydroxybenzoate transporter PcaK n=1 Tax=Georgfuchsia toluolica TaxID=424218 RepID=A0A916N8B9_9PROT|nr:MFS transporter [Georgfuchsia toluolica]CAG4883077.1 putative 4-hydroxybenzoate transporter PcaK [Georgfuchsia toluolica]
MATSMDIAAIIDRQKFGSFHLTVVGVSFLLMLVDGYDNISIAYIAPLLIQEWGVDKSALGPLFSAGLLGGLFGPPLFGYLGDRYGRKTSVILGAFFFGLFTLAQVWANSLGSMMALRFIAGIGIGGVLPITIALNTEFAPRRIRGSMTMLSFVGVALGGALGGLVSSLFMKTHGWQIIFWSGGIAPLLVGLLALFVFPESLKFLSLKPARRAELLRVLARLAPGLSVADDTRFVLSDEANRAKFAFKDLFEGRLAWITPLFWIANVISLLVFFFVNQWTPVLLASAGFPVERAALSTTLFMLGGFAGVLAIMRPVDKFGLIPVPILFAISIPAVGLIGVAGLPEFAVMGLVFLAGFCLIALQFGIIATESQVYPTYIRSVGVGSCFAFGRVGSVIGPLVGGAMLARSVPVQNLFYLASALLIAGLIAAAKLTPLYRARIREMGQRDTQADAKTIVAEQITRKPGT